MLIDFHAHSSGISRCCRIPIEKTLSVAKEIGLDGIVLTNHYKGSYVTDGNYIAFAKRYIEEYRHAKSLGDDMGLRVFFGIEVTMDLYPNVDLLIYGVDENFIIENPKVFELSQDKLYRLVHSAGGVLVQAHPYRKRVDRLLDTRYLDAIEINCHPLYESTHRDEIVRVAKETGKAITCGADYHADTKRAKCGVYLPDDFGGKDISAFIMTTSIVKIMIQEVDSDTPYNYTFERNFQI